MPPKADELTSAVTMPPMYQMPLPEIGDTVWFRFTPTDPPTPGIVQKIGCRSVDISTLRDGAIPQPREGVRHVSDPDLVNPHVAARGQWDFRPAQQRAKEVFERLVAEVGILRQKVQALETPRDKKPA